MKVAPLITVALILCIAFLSPIQAKKKPKPKPNKFCIGKDGNRYEVGQGYDDNEGKVCVQYKCVKKKKKFVMKKGKCIILTVDGEWSDWSRWSACTSTCGDATKTRKRTCSNPPPSDDGSPCPGMKEEIEECSLPSCGSVENVNVTALELNVQSLNDTMQFLNDSVQSLQTTMQAVLELMTTMQSTANKQGTCLSDLSSSDCPSSAAGKVGVVDGIAANAAGVSTNTDGINSNTDTCSSIQAAATKLETCLGDVNSVNCPPSKGGKTSVSDAIMENKDALMTHHPAQTDCLTPEEMDNGRWQCNNNKSSCYLKCNPGYASLFSLTTCIDGAWSDVDKMECSPSVFLLLGNWLGPWKPQNEIDFYHPGVENITCSILPSKFKTLWTFHRTSIFVHNELLYICGRLSYDDVCVSLNMTDPSGDWKNYNYPTTSLANRYSHTYVAMPNKLFFIGGTLSEKVDNIFINGGNVWTKLPLENNPTFHSVPNLLDGGQNRYCIVKIDYDSFVITGGPGDYNHRRDVTKYNVTSETSTALPQLIHYRYRHSCIMVEEDGKQWIVVAGGAHSSSGGGLHTTERLDLNGGTQWESIGNLNKGRDGLRLAETRNGIIAIGGVENEEENEGEILNWATKEWKLFEHNFDAEPTRFGLVEFPASVFDCNISNKTDTTTMITTTSTTTTTTTTTLTTTTTTAATTTNATTTAGFGFNDCVDKWCLQDGTNQQYTRCESVGDGGNTCFNPEIKYGTTGGGIPSDYYGWAFSYLYMWCEQIFNETRVGSATTGPRDCSAPKGKLYWYRGYDEESFKWIDMQDGYWKDNTLDYHWGCSDVITSVTCDHPPTFEDCVDKWCLQSGTNEQYTRCESVTDGGNTCVNPEIKYGTTEGGIPGGYPGYGLDEWCFQIFQDYNLYGYMTTGPRDCSAPKGKLWWCRGYDGGKWCDWQDGKWKNDTLDYHSECSNVITSVSCIISGTTPEFNHGYTTYPPWAHPDDGGP